MSDEKVDLFVIGVELGALGTVMALAIALIMLWRWRDLRGPALIARLGLFAMVAATMLVGHGAWQAWWIAVIYAGAALIVTFTPAAPSDGHESMGDFR